MPEQEALFKFARLRPRLLRIAYRMPGSVTLEHNDVPQTTALAIEGERIVAIYIMRNPEKLRHMCSVACCGGMSVPA